jgi:iron complex outermembrane recepter protein
MTHMLLYGLLTLFTFTVRGEVRDALTGRPLAGATIHAGAAPVVATSDSIGRFRIELDAAVRLRIVRSGYIDLNVNVASDTSIVLLMTPVTHALERVTVTAIRGDAGAEAAPISHATLSVEQLESRYSGQEMPLLLLHTPSLTAYADGGAYSNYTYFRIRGIDQTRVNITLDGIPLNDAEDQGVFFSNFPDFGNGVQSVQVQRGVGTSSLGTAAYAGSVNFESPSLFAAGHRGEMQLGRGSYNTTRWSGEWRGPLAGERLSAYARLSGQTTDGYRHASGNRSLGAFASIGYQGTRTIAKLTALSGVSRNELAYLASSEEEIAADPRSNPLRDSDRFWQQVVGLHVSRQLAPGYTLGATAYNVSAGGDYDVTFDGVVSNFNLASRMNGVLGTFAAHWAAADLSIGAHANAYHRDHFLYERPDPRTRLYSNRGDKDEGSLFAKVTWRAGRATWLADVQLRRAWFEYTPDANAGVAAEHIDWMFVNPKVGVNVRLTPSLQGYASYGSNGREPTRNDMFAGFDNLDDSNAEFVGSFDRVRPERVRDVEAGLRYRDAAVALNANVFDMRFRNEIAPIGELSYIGLPLRKNVRASFRQGVEIDAAYESSGPLAASGSVTLMRARIDEYTDDASGLTFRDVEPLLTPRLVANHRMSYSFSDRSTVHVDGRYVGSSFLANTGDRRFMLPAAYTMDATVTLGVGAHEILLHVRNLTNRLTYTSGYSDGSQSYYYVLARRNVMLTARLGW